MVKTKKNNNKNAFFITSQHSKKIPFTSKCLIRCTVHRICVCMSFFFLVMFKHVYRVPYTIIKLQFIIKWLETFMNIHNELSYMGVYPVNYSCSFFYGHRNRLVLMLDVLVFSFFFNRMSSMVVQMTIYRLSKSIKFEVSAWVCERFFFSLLMLSIISSEFVSWFFFVCLFRHH